MSVHYACTHTCASLGDIRHCYGPSVFVTCLRTAPNAVALFQQAKKGLLTLTVRTRLTAPPPLCSHVSPPLCRSLSSSTCGAQDSSPFSLEGPASPASTAKPNYRIMVEVSLKKGASAVPAFAHCRPGQAARKSLTSTCSVCPAGPDIRAPPPSSPPSPHPLFLSSCLVCVYAHATQRTTSGS